LELAAFSAVVAVVVPAMLVTGNSVHRNIQRARAGRSGFRFGRMSSALIVADVALAVAVVGFAVGLADRSLWAAGANEAVGFPAEEYLSVQLRLPQTQSVAGRVPSNQSESILRVAETQRALLKRLRAEPGIRGVATGSSLPRMQHRSARVDLEGEASRDDFRGHRVRTTRVALGFFTALEAPILSGRDFVTNDLGDGGSAVMVNTTFVEHVLGGRNPIGRRVPYWSSASREPGPWYDIVGVVDQLGMKMVDPTAGEGMYHPMAHGEVNSVRLSIRVGDHPASFTPRVRAITNEVDPTAVIEDPSALHKVYEGDWYIQVAMTLGFTVLVGIMLMLAAPGIYAIMSFTVAEGTREIGIRAALGAQRSSIAFGVARRALVQIAMGALIGTPISWTLFVASRADEFTGSAVVMALIPGVGVMILVALLACTVPTLRALRIMPAEALQGEG
jgi:putative ABC transport system permease protein